MKSDVIFICKSCKKQLPKWMGRCSGCGEWNCVEEKQAAPKSALYRIVAPDENAGVLAISEISIEHCMRIETTIQELDRVMGGGIVPRSVSLVGGDPGIGKTTLLMQALSRLAENDIPVCYISGEESAEQLKLRAERLGITSEHFLVLIENQLESILDTLGTTQASVIVLDSVQSIYSKSFEGNAGSVSQVRYVAGRILETIKRGTSACFIVGHVTKDGAIAGPKVLEHIVDTVLYFEGERNHSYRILRAVKNRFGSVSEIGVFEMSENGLSEVQNPSELFLSERPVGVSGSTVTALVEGSRPILAEIQALVGGSLPGQGRRTCLGTDPQRLALVSAVIEKKIGLSLTAHDIFLNAVGGVKALEPATDLSIAAALLSSYFDRVIPSGTLIFGELGLSGEIRSVARAKIRINEAARLGFNRIIVPKRNAESDMRSDIQIIGCSNINEFTELLHGD
jgi:DNA repair protein RadA/Sms